MRLLSLTYGDMHANRHKDAFSKRVYNLYAHAPGGVEADMLDFVPMRSQSGPQRVSDRVVIHRRKAAFPSLYHHLGRAGFLPEHLTYWTYRAAAPLLLAGFLRGRHAVVVDRFVTAGLLSAVPGSMPVIYASHNVEADWYGPVVAKTRAPAFYQSFLESMEGRLARRASLITAVSQGDKQRFMERYGIAAERIAVVPMGFVEEPRADPAAAAAALASHGLDRSEKLALFCGANFYSNQEAVDLLADVVAPRLDPGIRLVVVGSVSRHLEGKYGDALPRNMSALGFVDDLSGLYAAIPLALNSVVSGSGANVKNIEYLGAGMDLLTTPFGVRGYEDLRDEVLVEDVQGFAGAINAYFQGRRLARSPERLAAFGYSRLAERFFGAVRAALPAPEPQRR